MSSAPDGKGRLWHEDELKHLAESCGLLLLGVTSRLRLESELSGHIPKLKFWQESGYSGEMSYMKRPAQMFSSLEHLLPSACSVLSFAFDYASEEPSSGLSPELIDCLKKDIAPSGFGRVARYAWGRDYHRVIKNKLAQFVALVQKHHGPGLEARIFVDAVPLLERALMAQTGAGFIGRNSLFIRPKQGSFVFGGEVVWNLDVECSNRGSPPPVTAPGENCGRCSACLEGCPTMAIVADGVIDSRLCISYLTIEKRGAFSREEADSLGSWIFGCDLCQDVCPFNNRGNEHACLEEFDWTRGAGPYLSLIEILNIRSNKQFEQLFAGTPLMRAHREGLVRNACAVVANTKYFEAIPVLNRIISEDDSQIICYHATECLARLHEFADGLDRARLEKYVRRRERCTF